MYATYYVKDNSYNDEIEEFLIPYAQKDAALTAFLDEYSNKSIVITFSKDNRELTPLDFRLLNAIAAKYENVKFCFPIGFTEIYDVAKENGWKYFFSNHCYCWDIFYTLLNENPTDIYITDELCFQLRKISAICKEKQVKIRVFPNLAQSKSSRLPALRKFFVRPEGIPIFSPFVDIWEIYGAANRLDLGEIYYKIYAKDKNWYGDLSEMIIGLSTPLQSTYLPLDFERARVRCGHSCIKGGKCNLCEIYKSISETINDKK